MIYVIIHRIKCITISYKKVVFIVVKFTALFLGS